MTSTLSILNFASRTLMGLGVRGLAADESGQPRRYVGYHEDQREGGEVQREEPHDPAVHLLDRHAADARQDEHVEADRRGNQPDLYGIDDDDGETGARGAGLRDDRGGQRTPG